MQRIILKYIYILNFTERPTPIKITKIFILNGSNSVREPQAPFVYSFM